MKKILIILNTSWVRPGLFEKLLKEKNIPYEMCDVSKGEHIPNVKDFAGVVVMGGEASANDQTPEMKAELAKIQECLQLNIPYLGSCLGLQALVKAGGGSVVPAPTKEYGLRDPNGDFFNIEITPDGSKDLFLQGLGAGFETVFSHGESVELTPEMKLLGTGKFCKNQIVKVGKNAYGMQCHPEITPELFEIWKQNDPAFNKMDSRKLDADYEGVRSKYEQVGRQLFENFLHIAGY